MKRTILVVCLLTLVYALVLGSFAAWDLLIGAGISAVLVLLLRPPGMEAAQGPTPHLFIRILAFFPFAVAVALDVIGGTWNVALVALGVRPVKPSGVVEVPMDDRTKGGIVVTALISTLSPGAVLIDVDESRRVMVFHVLGADPTAFRSSQQEFYRRYQRRVFP